MNKSDGKIRIIAAVIALLIALALAGGATFAWLNISRTPEISKVRTIITNTQIVEIALADSEKIDFDTLEATGPDEVGENDLAKGQVTWGRVITMETTEDDKSKRITLQAPATYDKDVGLSTVRFSEEDGRPEGFEPLEHGRMTTDGIVYYVRKPHAGESYVNRDGHIVLADGTEEGYAAAGGVAVWLRSNAEAQIDVLLKGTSIVNADDDIPIELLARVWKLNEKSTLASGAKKGTLEELGIISCTRITDEDGNPSFQTTLQTEKWNNMIPGVQYLVEIICYIEGDTLKNRNALIAQSVGDGDTGRKIEVDIGDVSYDTLACSPYVTVTDAKTGGAPVKFGQYYVEKPNVLIGAWSDSGIDETLGIECGYELKQEGKAPVTETFPITDESDRKVLTLDDGEYTLTAWITDNIHKNADGSRVRLYAVNFDSKYMMNQRPAELHLTVDTVKPEIEILEPEDGIFSREESVTVKVRATEEHVSRIKIDDHTVKNTRSVIIDDEGKEKTVYLGERVFTAEGDYNVKAVVIDMANQQAEASRKFVIDRTEPEITDIRWTYVNSGILSELLHSITGGLFFPEAVQIEAAARDIHLEDYRVIPLQDSGKVDTRIESSADGNTRIAYVTIDADYAGEIEFYARDKAGNEGNYKTKLFRASGLNTDVTQTPEGLSTDSRGVRFDLSDADGNKFETDHYEYSPDGGEHWYRGTRTIGDVTYTVEATQIYNGKLIMGSRVNVTVEEGRSYEGTIRFRAMTRALSTGDFRVYSKIDNLPGEDTEDYDIQLDRTH